MEPVYLPRHPPQPLTKDLFFLALRGICTLREVLQALHMHLSGCHSRWNDLANGKLRSEVLNAIRDKVKYSKSSYFLTAALSSPTRSKLLCHAMTKPIYVLSEQKYADQSAHLCSLINH